jgi:hypothetical protein
MDFIYGVTLSDRGKFVETIRQAIALARIGWLLFLMLIFRRFTRAILLDKIGLPSGNEKSRMYEALAICSFRRVTNE